MGNQSNPQTHENIEDYSSTIAPCLTNTCYPELANPPHSPPAQTERAKLSNSERCKIFRERKKKKDQQLLADLETEERKNSMLSFRAKILEDKVEKFKKIILKRAKTQKIIMSHESMS